MNSDSYKDRLAHVRKALKEIFIASWKKTTSEHALACYAQYEKVAICHDVTAWPAFCEAFSERKKCEVKEIIELKTFKNKWVNT